MASENNMATMQWKVVEKTVDGVTFAVGELFNGYGAIQIPAETLRAFNNAVQERQNELTPTIKEKRWYAPLPLKM